jgi:HAD superfamily hydrolase (TIGR01509 family)
MRERAMIKAVVLDIGSVLEVIDDAVFPAPFEQRHGLTAGSVHAAAASLPGDAGRGELTEAEVHRHFREHLALDDARADELMADYWRWYVGTLDQELFDWFAGQRPERKTGIVSNSGPGAREAERCWGFEEITDDIVYSHEVGLLKPDPRIFVLAAERLGVRPEEIVFLDDVEGHVEAARAVGYRAVVHHSTPESIARIEAVIEAERDR